jgi:hypothetical protein
MAEINIDVATMNEEYKHGNRNTSRRG